MSNWFALATAAMIPFGFLAPTSGSAHVIVHLGAADGLPVPTYNGFYTVVANTTATGFGKSGCTVNSAGTCSILTGVAASIHGTGSYSLPSFELESNIGAQKGDVQIFKIYTGGFYDAGIPLSIAVPGLDFSALPDDIRFTALQQDLNDDVIRIGLTALDYQDRLKAVGFFTFVAPGVLSTLSENYSYFLDNGVVGGPLTGRFDISYFGVPEPATWVTSLAGFAALGFAGFLRRLLLRFRLS
jgi:hypothetical protein